jgi:hypothetical protein
MAQTNAEVVGEEHGAVTTIAHCSETEEISRPSQLTEFSGGTRPSADVDKPPLRHTAGFGTSAVQHRFGNAKAGFDKAVFSSPDAFRAVLDEHNLPEHPIVVDTSGDRGDSFEFGAYVWVNTRVLLITKYNPLTGRQVQTRDTHVADPGLAHYIGIEGESSAVDALATTISRRLTNGSQTTGERRYI